MLGNEGDDWIEAGTFDGAPGDNFDEIFGRRQRSGHDVFLGDGGFDEFIGEGGDDIMVGSPGINRDEGMSGFDWITYMESGGLSADANNPGLNGVYADLELDAFDENPVVPFPFTSIDRYDSVEGMSGGHYNDILLGSNSVELITPAGGNGAQGSELTQAGINLITGLQAVVGAGVTSFSTGDIMLGGDGSDTMEGRRRQRHHRRRPLARRVRSSLRAGSPSARWTAP